MSNKCLLEKTDCKGFCSKCGWNPAEAKRRQQMIAENKFATRWDGVKMLIIKREESK